jgi:two-component system, LuxR family, sensor kinase FixL
MMTENRTRYVFSVWQKLIFWSALYALAHWLVPYSTSEFDHIPIIWLPVGIALSAFIMIETSYVIIVAFSLSIVGAMSSYLTNNSMLMALSLTSCDIIGGVIGAHIYRTRIQPTAQYDLLRSVSLFLAILVALTGVLASFFSILSTTEDLSRLNLWALWFGSIALGILLVGRPLLAFDCKGLGFGTRKAQIESSLFLLTAFIIGILLFKPSAYSNIANLFWVQIIIPLVILTVIRRGSTVAILSIFIIGSLAAFATVSGLGPISTLPALRTQQIIWLQSLLAIATIIIMFIAAAMGDRQRARNHDIRQTAILAAIEDSSIDALISIDQKGSMLTANPAAEKLFGYKEQELIGRNVKMLMPPHFREHHDGYLNNYMTTGKRKIIGTGRVVAGERKDGTTFPMELSVGEATLEGERIFVGTVRDLSEVERDHKRLQELQSELFHVSRLSEMGQIAANLAHEVNQPLAAIMNYAQAATETAKVNQPIIEGILSKIMAQATRAAEIIKRLRAFIEKREIEKQKENLNALIEESLALALVGSARRNIKIRLALSQYAPHIHADRVQIQQVIVNLVRNAMDAMDGMNVREIEILSKIVDNSIVEVAIADTGRGIDPKLKNRLFIAFVSTKEHGMGVGLSICKTIIDNHGGKIWHEAGTNCGSVFHFSLPLACSSVNRSMVVNG